MPYATRQTCPHRSTGRTGLILTYLPVSFRVPGSNPGAGSERSRKGNTMEEQEQESIEPILCWFLWELYNAAEILTQTDEKEGKRYEKFREEWVRKYPWEFEEV